MSSKDSWATPMPVYLALDSEFDFSADLCASDSNAKHPIYLTEQDDALLNWREKLGCLVGSGKYAWCNPPYSKIAPWISTAIEMQKSGIGTVMLVMADSSVGWYYDALQHCNEIREVVKGRLAFISPETGQPVGGNNKGSVLLIFDPYGRQSPPRRTYIERDQLTLEGAELMATPELLFTPDRPPLPEFQSKEPPKVAGNPPESTEKPPELTGINVGTIGPIDKSPNLDWGESAKPQTAKEEVELEVEADPQARFNPHQLLDQFLSGKLKAEHFPIFIAALVIMFGEQDTYHIKQIQVALVAEAEDPGVTITGLIDYQRELMRAAGRSLRSYGIVSPNLQVQAVAAMVQGGALKENSIKTILNGIDAKFSQHLPRAETNEA